MPRRIALTELNASTLDIINTIRANASQEYQELVPEITDEKMIPSVGEKIYGYPALANQFVNALVNRIALVKINSATFNNAYAELKKGFLEFGETVEEVFVGICKAREFSVEKAKEREFKRTLPDVKSAFHAMNWRVYYPITIQQEDLKRAFLNISGVQDLIARIVNEVYTAAEYDEYLLFKYLLIKNISHGKMFPVPVDLTSTTNLAKAFRGVSNQMTFLKREYNESNVLTNTDKNDQYIFMDSDLNAEYDVDVLAGAFNMGKAEFIGKLKLIDDWTTFDNERFDIIRENCDMIEPVTEDELELMKGVKAVIADKEWFQVYDNLAQMTDTKVSNGLYWNYFYHVWKTISSSPFSNAVVFVDNTVETSALEGLTVSVKKKIETEHNYIFTFDVEADPAETLSNTGYNFVQTADATENGIAVHKYGGVVMPKDVSYQIVIDVDGTVYTCDELVGSLTEVGDTFSIINTTDAFKPTSISIDNITLTPSYDEDTYIYEGSGSTGATGAVTVVGNEEVEFVVKKNGVEIEGSQSWVDGDIVTVQGQIEDVAGQEYMISISLS